MATKLKKEEAKELDLEKLKEMIENETLPTDIGQLIFSKISKELKKVADLRKKKKGKKSDVDLKVLAKENNLSEKELESQIALHDLILNHKELFLKILEPSQTAEKIRASGHYFDVKLKYSVPDKNQKQMSIFDVLENPRIKQQIAKVDYVVSAVGINLNPAENKLISALIKLLQDKSETKNVKSENFYRGNSSQISTMKNYGGTGIDERAPVLKLKPAELYKAYLDSKEYSGAEIKVVKGLIESLAKKNFLITYERKKKGIKNGKEEILTDIIEDFQPLFKILCYTPDLTEEELATYKQTKEKNKVFEQKGEYLIALNPVFVDQIDQKYVEFPRDIEKRTAEAAGGSRKVTEADIALRDWILRELSNRRTYFEISEDKLAYVLKLGNYIKQRKKKVIQERTELAIKVCKNLGILEKVETEFTTNGQPKFCFYLKNPFS